MMFRAFVWTLLFCVCARANVTLNQSPQQITVTEGDSVQLNCSGSESSVGGISWYKDVETIPVSNSSTWYQYRVHTFFSPGILNMTIRITDLKMNDSGRYYCRLDSLTDRKVRGSGTEVTVKQLSSTPGSRAEGGGASGAEAMPATVTSNVHAGNGKQPILENGDRRAGANASGKDWSPKEKVIYPIAILSLTVVLIILGLGVIIYIKHRWQSPDKESGPQAKNKEEDGSQSITYAELQIRKSTNNRSPHYSAGESTTSQEQRRKTKATGSDRMECPAPTRLKQSPWRNEEQVVYATVNMKRLKS